MKYTGLSSLEAQKRLQEFGENRVTSLHKIHPWQIFFNQLKSPLIYILIFAAILSAFLHEYTEAIFIIIVVLINSILGFTQEYKAENTLETLRSKISKTIKVIRDGNKVTIASQYLVPGDILILESGLKVPGDGELLEATELIINESILTGESEPVSKVVFANLAPEADKREGQIFKGATVIEGMGVAQITATGNKTYFGGIAESLSSEFDPETPIKFELKKLSRIISIFVLILITLVITLGISRGLSFHDIFSTSVALGVSTIPEGLIIALTITLAIGMNRIMAKQAIVKNLPAAETLGDIQVLCIDKTGTLTYGQMQVDNGEFTNQELAIKALAMCNNDTNFIDKALAQYIMKNTHQTFLEDVQAERKVFTPFSSLKKFTAAADANQLFVVGAPDILLNKCAGELSSWNAKLSSKAAEGKRIVGIAYKDISNLKQIDSDTISELKFLGLVFITDPVRHSVKAALKKIASAGVEVKVITGDLKATSLNVLKELDFAIEDEQILSGSELAAISDQNELDKRVQTTRLFYRVTPDQKLTIVASLQRQKLRVGMMGDGVNDSPALKRAEIGIGVDNATDVSKEVADIILLDSNFQTILDAIEEGRNIFQNLRKIMIYLFADSLSETVIILCSLIFNLPLPLLPLQLLWINLVEDGLPSLALSFDKAKNGLLQRRPRRKNESIIDNKAMLSILSIGLVMDLFYFLIYRQMVNSGVDITYARTFTFAGVAVSSLLFLFAAKTLDSNIWKQNIFDNRAVNVSVLIGFALMLTAIYFPPIQNVLETTSLAFRELVLVFCLASIDLLLVEFVKLIISIRRKT